MTQNMLTISEEMLQALNLLYRFIPLKLSTLKKCGRQIKTSVICSDELDKAFIEYDIVFNKNSEKYHKDNFYLLICNNRKFDVTLYDSPECDGHYSSLPDYDNSAYVYCHIIEMQENDTIKYEMKFGFDIEKKTFLELFILDHHESNIIIPHSNDLIENHLKGKIIIN